MFRIAMSVTPGYRSEQLSLDAVLGAQAYTSSQAAIMVYLIQCGSAAQSIMLVAKADSVLVILPNPAIPFPRSPFALRISDTVQPVNAISAALPETLDALLGLRESAPVLRGNYAPGFELHLERQSR